MTNFAGTVHQGTSSTRCMFFAHDGGVNIQDQLEHLQIVTQAGRVARYAPRSDLY